LEKKGRDKNNGTERNTEVLQYRMRFTTFCNSQTQCNNQWYEGNPWASKGFFQVGAIAYFPGGGKNIFSREG